MQLQWRRRGGRTPRDVRAVEHRVVLVNPRIGPLATQNETWHLGRAPVSLSDNLVDAGTRTNLATRGKRRPGKQIAGLRTVNVPLRFRRPFMLGERFHLASQTSVF